MADNVTNLYNELTKNNYDLGSIEQFKKDIAKEKNRKALHNELTKNGYDLGDLNQFSSDLGYGNATATPKQPTQPNATTQPSVSTQQQANQATTPSVQPTQPQNQASLVPTNEVTTDATKPNNATHEKPQENAQAEKANKSLMDRVGVYEDTENAYKWHGRDHIESSYNESNKKTQLGIIKEVAESIPDEAIESDQDMIDLLNANFTPGAKKLLNQYGTQEQLQRLADAQKRPSQKKELATQVDGLIDRNKDFFAQFFYSGQDPTFIKDFIVDNYVYQNDGEIFKYADDEEKLAQYLVGKKLGMDYYLGPNAFKYYMNKALSSDKAGRILEVASYINENFGRTEKVIIPHAFLDMMKRTMEYVTKPDENGITPMDVDEYVFENGYPYKKSRGDIFIEKALDKLNTYAYIIETIPTREEREKHLGKGWEKNIFTNPWDAQQGLDEISKAQDYELAEINKVSLPDKMTKAEEHLAELEKTTGGKIDKGIDFAKDVLTGKGNLVTNAAKNMVENVVASYMDSDNSFVKLQQTKATIKLLEDAQNMANTSKSDGSLSRLWKGLKEGAADDNFWTQNLAGIAEGFLIEEVMKKYNVDKDNLTKEEEMLMDAFFTKLSIEAYTDRGIAYDVGRSIPDAIGFMIALLTTKAGAATKGLSSKFAKWAIKKYGSKALRENAVKYTLGNVLTKGVDMASTALKTNLGSGIGYTASNVAEGQQMVYNPDEDKFVRNESLPTSLLKGLYKSFTEVFVEEAGGPIFKSIFNPIGQGLGKVSSTYTQAKGLWDNFAGGQGFKKFKNLTGFHGAPIEFGEEILTDIANMPVTDDTFDTDEKTGIFGARRMVTTALSCLAIGAIMNAPNVAKYKSESKRIANYRNDLNNVGQLTFHNKWGNIKNRIDNATPSEIEGIVMDEMMKGNYTAKQKKVILKYAGARVQSDALLMREKELEIEAKASKVIDAQNEVEQRSRSAYNATAEDEQREALLKAQQAADNVKQLIEVGEEQEPLSVLLTRYDANDANELVAKVVNDKSLTYEQKNAILDYVGNDAAKQAVMQRNADDANQQIAQATKEVTSRANTDNPDVIVSAQTKVGDRQVTVIAGNVVTIEDETASEGGMIDKAKSSKSIVIQDVETGEKKMASVDDIFNVNTTSVTAQLDERVAQIKAEYDAKMKNITTGNRTFTPNQQITIPTEDGSGIQNAVVAEVINGEDGTIQITYVVEGATEPVTMPKTDVESRMDDAIRIKLKNKRLAEVAPIVGDAQVEVAQPLSTTTEQVGPTRELVEGDVVTFEENGTPIQGIVSEIYDDGIVVQTDNGVKRVNVEDLSIVEQGENAETPSSQEILDNSQEGAVDEPIKPTESNEASKLAEGVQQQATPATAETTPQVVQESAENAKATIPTDEKGNPMYEKASVETTINDIYNDPELDEEEADAYVQARIDGATQRIADLEAKKPKMGESKEAYIAERATWREELATQQASLDYWNGVQETRAKAKSSETNDAIDESNVPMMSAEESDEGNKLSQEEAQAKAEAERVAREKAREKAKEAGKRAEERGRNRGDYRKAMAQWEDAPSSFYEYVAQALLVGDHKMRWNDSGSTRGLGRHTTGRRGTNRRGQSVVKKNEEAKMWAWLIDDHTGVSPEVLADRLWNEYTGSYGEDMREGSPLDVLLDVVTSMPTPQMMWEYVKGEHDARMEAEQDGYEEQYSKEEIEAFERDAMYREKYGVSEEEYWAQEALWDEFIESRDMSTEELENYDNFVAEQRIKEEYERRNQENAEDEQRSNNSESERGTDVLSGTQSDNTRGNGDVAGESEGIDGSSVEQDDVAQEEARLSEEDRQAIENMPIPMLKRQIKETTTTLINVSQLSSEWQEKNRDKIERAKLILAYAKEELARKERLKKSNKWGIKVGNTATPFSVVRKMFGEFNSNEDIAQLFDKVAKVFESLPIKIVFSDTIGSKGTQGWFSPTTATLKLPGHFVYGGRSLEQSKAETILHEMIHAVTTYALYINEKPHLQTHLGFRLSDDMHAAIRQLKRIYASIASDKDFKGEYGAVSVHEMIAELSNVQFREKLKKKGLWQTIVDAIKQLFGIEPSNALEGAEAALEYMLNNFDRSQWDKMVGMGRKRSNQMRNEDNDQDEKQSTKKKNPRLEESKADTEENAVKTLEEVYRKGDGANKERAKTAVLNALQDNTSLESVDATLSNIRGRKRRIGWRKRQTSGEARAEYRALKFLEKAYASRARELYAMDRLGKALGVTIEVVDQVDGGKANAKIVGNKILIDKDADQGVKEALAHEMLHRIKALSEEAYESFAKALEGVFSQRIDLGNGQQSLTFQEMMVAKRILYSQHGMDISLAGVREEVVADMAGILMTNAELMEKFVESTEGKPWYKEIWDTIKEIFEVAKAALKGVEYRDMMEAEYVLLDAIYKAVDVQANPNKANKVEPQDVEKHSLAGIKGATALDRAEEVTQRMDNLDMARKMERFDYPTKSIRMATGWERGVDGKWRYEIDDFDIELPSRDSVIGEYNKAIKEERMAQSKWEAKSYRNATLPRASKKNTQEENDAIRNKRKEANKEEKELFASLNKIRGHRLELENQLRDGIYCKLSDIIAKDSEIFISYPQLKDITITIAPHGRYLGTGGYRGSYNSATNSMFLDWNMTEEEMKSTLTHEVQHVIQTIEGFAKGTNVEASEGLIAERDKKALIWSFKKNIDHIAKDNPGLAPLELIDKAVARRVELTGDDVATLEEQGAIPNEDGRIKAYNLWARGYDNEGYENAYNMVLGDDAYEVYRRHAGEVEARNVQSRIGMTPEQRRSTLLADTEDVARKDQIFLMENSGVSAMAENEIDIAPLLNVVKTLYTKGKEFASKLFSMKFFDVAKTPDFMKQLGLRGDKFTIRYGVIARHFGKDSEHALPYEIWKQLPEALLHPFAITKYYEDSNKQKQKGYRLYTSLQLANGSYVVVSAEVKNSGRDIDVNAINTVFGRSSLSEVHDKLIYTSETITPEQQSLLNGNNPHQYTAERELSADKGSDNIGDVQGLEDYSAEELKEIAREYIEDVIAESGFDAEVVDLAIYGSRRRGDAREDSDLDIVVEYSGNAREDDLFNALNDAETQLEIDGVKVDINPITKSKSGTLGEFMERAREYDEGKGSKVVKVDKDTKEDSEEGLLFRDGEVFYSNAEEAVRNIKQEKATPEQWLAMIQKNGGLKAGEDKWLGLSDWLKASDAKTLTKEEVLEFINQNKIVIEEVGYGGDSIASAQSEFDELAEGLGGYDEAFEEMVNRYGDDFREAVWYDEVGQLHLEDGYEDYGEILGIERGINRTRLDYTTEGLENKKEIALVVPSVDPYNAHDEIHFGDAGGGRAVAWVRFGETTDENGNRVLVIDEIQSKRHQDGREKGYRDADVPNRVEDARKAVAEAEREFADFRNAMQEKYDYDSLVQGSAEERKEGRKAWRGKFTPEEMIKYDQLHDATIDARNALEEARQSQSRVPDAPFEKNWHELAMKRMLRYAAENGFDKVAWTTGAQQAERYDMGSVVKTIRKGRENDIIVIDLKNGEYIPLVVDENGLVINGRYQGEKLSNIIGKELAEKAMDLPIGESLADVDLHIGGEGMKGFYDKMLPSFMNKYGKKWGVKVGETTMPNIGDGGLTMHSVDVTDAMKESVMEGQPMFRDGSGALSDTDLSYANDPFAKALGKSQRTKAQQAKFAERERKYMRNRVAELAEKMHLDNVEVVESETTSPSTPQSHETPSPQSGTPPKQGSGGELDNPNKTSKTTMSERKARAKGWFDTRTGKIVINISNHTSVADVERTLLHEAVAHYGLRQLFGKQFDTFLDNVYRFAEADIRAQIVELAKKHGWDFRTATEEYLAGLAEDTNFEYLETQTSFWMKIKQFFMDMLESIGWRYQGPELSDNELRYLLWRSYENMVNPGRHRSILGMAEDTAKQYELGVGNYSADAESMSQVAEEWEKAEPQPIGNGAFGAIYTQFRGKAKEAIAFLMRKQSGEAIGALSHPEIGEIDLVWGKEGTSHSDGYGLAKLVKYHPEVLDNLQEILSGMNVVKRSPNRVQLESNTHKASVRLTWDNQRKTWLLTAFEKKETPETTISSTGVDNSPKGLLDDTAPQQSSSVSADKVNNNNSEKQENNGSNGSTNAERDSDEGILFRDGDVTIDDLGERDRVIARDAYERMMSQGRYQFTEAMQDSMMGLKLLYKAILGKKMQVENIPDFENAYIAENLMSSQNAAMQQEYYIKFMKPLVKAINALGGKDKAKRQAIIDYMMAKHGLERNLQMAHRDAKALADEAVYGIQFNTESEKQDTWQKAYDKAYKENREVDYAGLTALTGTDKVAEAEAKATEMVEQFETDNNKDNAVTELWARVNDATKANLERLRKGGVISTQQYRDTLEMYEYYIPLRGWDATTSDEVYAYLTSKNSGMMGSTMKMSKGRKSKADDPIATIGAMADSAIREANRNAMKQRFLNFVFNHPSDLVSLNSIWLQKDEATGEWVPVFADIKKDDAPEAIERKIEEFEAKMRQLKKDNPSKYKNGKEAQNIPYVVKPGMDREHQVMVKRNGQTYILTINGNPRAAQALNGLTNPDVDVEGWIGKLLNGAEKVNRQLSAFYTTRNPDFVVSNFSRDMIYSNAMVWVKESPKYAVNFHANCGVAFTMLPKLLIKWERGTLDMNNSLEEMFYQFMINGGETGYTEIRDVEKHKRMIASELKKHKNVVKNKWHALGAVFDGVNRQIENTARFAAFKTSREMGRTVQRSAYDAKEISVNFNKKGSGAKMLGATGQTFWGDFGAWNSGLGRTWWVFWNAGVQGMTNFGKNVKRHPVKATALMSLAFVLGACAPTWNDDDDDDKKKYYLIPEYIRRSNICFRVWGDTWCTIPLPIELRAMYGLGELYTAVTSGGEKLSNEELAYAIAGQVSQVLPLDMLEGGGGLNALIPTAIKPIVEAYRNIGWHGGPIHREFYTSDMADTTPQWTLAYPSVSSFLMNFTKALNEWSGGENYEGVEGAKPNDAIKGEIDLNPAKIEYVLKGYFGGVYTTFNNIIKSTETVFGDRKFEAKNTPVYNRLFKEDDPEAEKRKYNKIFYKDKEADAIMEKRIKNATKFSKGSLEYADKLAQLQKSDEYKSYVYRKGYKEAVKLIQKRLNYGDELINEEDLNTRIDALKKEMAEGMESADNKSVKKLEIESAKRALQIDKDFKDVDANQNEIKGKKRAEELKEQGASATKIKRSKGYYEGYKKRQTKEFDEREAEIRRMESDPEDLFDEEDHEEQGD